MEQIILTLAISIALLFGQVRPINEPDVVHSIDLVSEFFINPGKFTIELKYDNDGNTYVRYDGDFTYMTDAALNAFLEKYNPSYLELSSDGGNMDKIDLPGYTIQAMQIPVRIKRGESCVSACAFLAMYSPDIQIDGQLAFHAPYWQDIKQDSWLNRVLNITSGGTYEMYYRFKDNNYSLYLYYLIERYSNSYTFITFDSTEELNKYKVDTDLDGQYSIRTSRGLHAFKMSQING